MPWYHYLEAFFAGLFLANFAPHYVKGVCGDPFPTPFAKPPGKGLSSPIVNTLWALLNLVLGYLLFRTANIAASDTATLLTFFAGIVLISIQLSTHFVHKHTS